MEGREGREQPIGKGVARPKGQRDVIRDLEVRLGAAYRSQEEAGRMVARAEEGRAELRNTCVMLAVGVYESGAKAMGLHDALVAVEAIRAQLESSERRLELAEWATSKAIEELVQADPATGGEGMLPSCSIVWNGNEAKPWAVKIRKR